MGHLFSNGFIKASNKDEAVKKGLARAESFAYYEGDRMEGSHEYHGNFYFFDKKFDNEDEALEYFDSLGSYTDGVVMVKYPSKASSDRYYSITTRYHKRIQDIKAKYREAFKNRKSNTTSCKKCNIRYPNSMIISQNFNCPNCHNLMLPEGILKKIELYKQRIEEAELAYKQDINDNGQYRYYYKVEIHI